jgi:hypothetical protein
VFKKDNIYFKIVAYVCRAGTDPGSLIVSAPLAILSILGMKKKNKLKVE